MFKVYFAWLPFQPLTNKGKKKERKRQNINDTLAERKLCLRSFQSSRLLLYFCYCYFLNIIFYKNVTGVPPFPLSHEALRNGFHARIVTRLIITFRWWLIPCSQIRCAFRWIKVNFCFIPKDLHFEEIFKSNPSELNVFSKFLNNLSFKSEISLVTDFSNGEKE